MLINVHSAFSLQYGTIPVEHLINTLIQNGHDTAVLTDINNSTGVLEFIREAKAKKFNGLGGVEFRNGNELKFIGIAKNTKGFQELNEFLTLHSEQNRPFQSVAPEWNHVFVIYPFSKDIPVTLRDFEYIGIKASQLTQLYGKDRSFLERLVMWHPVTIASRNDYEFHQQLRAICFNTLLSHLEPNQIAAPDETPLPPEVLISQFRHHSRIITNTTQLLEKCSFDFDFDSCKNKKTYTGSVYEDRLLLEKLAHEGCRQRYGNNPEALRRVKHELEIIDRLGFSAYFLITWDTIVYATWRGMYHVGRGSGANSIVAYCLRITNVCPMQLDLYFERFLNPKRKAPPDFDIDFSWKDRDEVTNYLFGKWRKEHTAMIGTTITFQHKSIVRELGKVYGLPEQEIKMISHYPDRIPKDNRIAQKILAARNRYKEFPNSRSIHAGGILISEEPITAYCALDMPPKGLRTTQFDMYTAENIGFEKLDILSQRGIGHINEAVQIIQSNHGVTLDVHDIESLKRDPKVNAQLKTADTIGCFYIESPAMRGVLSKLECDNYLTLVAASSIIRPGVGSSGMMDEYIKRHRTPDSTQYLHPVMKDHLSETYGVMIYQEDVLKIGHHYGGLDLAEADVLRRLMSGKNRGAHHLPEIKGKFFDYARQKWGDMHVTQEIWRQIESFAGYSFSKAHSAAFAVESYQSLVLKTYYPREFMVAVINNKGGFYSTWVYITEAQKTGACVHLPCVNNGRYETSIRDNDIYLGLDLIDSLKEETVEVILRSRHHQGAFTGLEDFLNRTQISIEQATLLVRAGALRFTNLDKKALLWHLNILLAGKRTGKKKPSDNQPLFRAAVEQSITLPNFEIMPEEHFYDEKEIFGFSFSVSPFDMLVAKTRCPIVAKTLSQYIGQTIRIMGKLVTTKGSETVREELMAFGTFYDMNEDFFDTVHFPQAFRQNPFRGEGVYLILGKVTLSFGFPSIIVDRMELLPIRPDPRFS
ncbi:DNA polymerase III subunit alpha [Chitinophaga rhizophila]|uniref:DNA-directed DNA polymerase n=1 Tax=Chitinophaga rhizophila TaxID=2866212 RepID=A0ABS7G777_9BACT|nr:DNA polymerase III subunit alpha [Chitinophaga rhizophila]MBW8683484.1 DNA polymerase III subunit alpha [Chitinophaga rhizophila]